MNTSEAIDAIAAALAKAQGEMGGALKDSANPFFKSKYADLASVWEACRGPLAKNGLAIVQSPSADGAAVSVETMLIHASGQWLRGTVTTTAKDDSPQGIGSAITYLRRYALQSFAGVAPEDDDAEAAHGRGKPPSRFDVPTPRPEPIEIRRTSDAPARPETREKPSAETVGDRGDLPDGFRLIDDYKPDGDWHHITWGRDAQGGWMVYKTKLAKVAADARAAFMAGEPVRLHSKKYPWLDKVERLGITRADIDGSKFVPDDDVPMLTDADVPF